MRDDVEDRIFSRMIFSEASYSFASSSFRRSTHNVNSSLINYHWNEALYFVKIS